MKQGLLKFSLIGIWWGSFGQTALVSSWAIYSSGGIPQHIAVQGLIICTVGAIYLLRKRGN